MEARLVAGEARAADGGVLPQGGGHEGLRQAGQAAAARPARRGRPAAAGARRGRGRRARFIVCRAATAPSGSWTARPSASRSSSSSYFAAPHSRNAQTYQAQRAPHKFTVLLVSHDSTQIVHELCTEAERESAPPLGDRCLCPSVQDPPPHPTPSWHGNQHADADSLMAAG